MLSPIGQIKILTGRQFGDLKVFALIGIRHRRTIWLCRCSCGKWKSIRGCYLTGGSSRSCGHLAKTSKERINYLEKEWNRKNELLKEMKAVGYL